MLYWRKKQTPTNEKTNDELLQKGRREKENYNRTGSETRRMRQPEAYGRNNSDGSRSPADSAGGSEFRGPAGCKTSLIKSKFKQFLRFFEHRSVTSRRREERKRARANRYHTSRRELGPANVPRIEPGANNRTGS